MADADSVRARLIAVVVSVAVVVLSGVYLDRAVGERPPPAGTAEEAPTGAWYCPHGGSLGWQAWVVITNPGPSPVRIRLTQLTQGRVRSVATFAVGSLRQVYREVSSIDPSDSTTVEYFGGWVGAAAVVRSGSPPGMAAERCEPAPRQDWFMLDVTTASGDAAYVVVMNPFAVDASFDVVIRTEQRRIAPGELSPVVVKAQSSVAVRVNDFALEGPGEQTVTAEVIGRIGRVVAAGFVRSPGGVRAEAGQADPARVTVLPAARFVGEPDLILFNPQQERAEVSVITSGRTGQRVISGTEPISLAPGEAKTIGYAEAFVGGMVVRADNGQPVLAALRMTGPFGDPASQSGVAAPGRSWLVMPCTGPAGGKSFLVLQNTGRTQLQLTVTLIGPDGVIAAPRLSSIALPGGRTISVAMAGPARQGPVTALVSAEGGTFVAAGTSYGRDDVGFAAAPGLPDEGGMNALSSRPPAGSLANGTMGVTG